MTTYSTSSRATSPATILSTALRISAGALPERHFWPPLPAPLAIPCCNLLPEPAPLELQQNQTSLKLLGLCRTTGVSPRISLLILDFVGTFRNTRSLQSRILQPLQSEFSPTRSIRIRTTTAHVLDLPGPLRLTAKA